MFKERKLLSSELSHKTALNIAFNYLYNLAAAVNNDFPHIVFLFPFFFPPKRNYLVTKVSDDMPSV